MARLFQQYKSRLNGGHLSFCVTMPSRKRHVQPQDEGDVVKAPEIDTCDLFPESTISPAFDPNRVLLRRVFFIGAEKSKYVLIGFYPTRNYQPLVELGGCEKSRYFSRTHTCGFWPNIYHVKLLDYVPTYTTPPASRTDLGLTAPALKGLPECIWDSNSCP